MNPYKYFRAGSSTDDHDHPWQLYILAKKLIGNGRLFAIGIIIENSLLRITNNNYTTDNTFDRYEFISIIL